MPKRLHPRVEAVTLYICRVCKRQHPTAGHAEACHAPCSQCGLVLLPEMTNTYRMLMPWMQSMGTTVYATKDNPYGVPYLCPMCLRKHMRSLSPEDRQYLYGDTAPAYKG